MSHIYKRIEQLHKLNENEKMIVKYLVDNLDQIPQLSSRELARRTYTSSTAIIRFIKKLGYQSYNDFKLHIVSDLKNLKLSDNSIVSKEDILSLINKMSDIEVAVISQTKEMLSIDVLNHISVLLNQYQYIDILASDANATIAKYASHILWRTGKIVQVFLESDLQQMMSIHIPNDHIVIAISKFGTQVSILKSVDLLKKRNIPLIAITSNKDSDLAKKCQYVLYGVIEDTAYKLSDIVFYISLKYLFDLLYVMIFSQNYEDTIQLDKLHQKLYFQKM